MGIKDILNNPFDYGILRYNRYVNWNDKWRRGKNNDPIVVEGQHEAIITNDLWKNVQFLILNRSFTPSRIYDGEFLLTELIRCPQCEATMVASRTKSPGKLKITYIIHVEPFAAREVGYVRQIAFGNRKPKKML